jgi:rhodanese-related sulfurtransferase
MSTEVLPAQITATELHARILDGGELALLDVREPAVTAREGTLLWSVSAPLSRIELSVPRLVPRALTPVVVLDGGDGELAGRGAARLHELGYGDVSVLAGGVRGWAQAGYKLHTGGTHVLGQAFGEFIEATYGTPHISVPELTAQLAAGEDIVLLDSRPRPEFEQHSLPGGTSIPGAELVYRAAAAIPSPDSLVVVNCAGRTRSILGAQTLINAGVPNRVVALEGGTMAWLLEGLDLDHGKVNDAPAPNAAGLEQAKQAARRIAERFAVQTIDHSELGAFKDEADERTLYLLDIRTPDEFARGHLAGSRSAPSWDASPWIFRHAATRNARVVLVDNADTVRATVAASWLIQIGWGEVFVLRDAFAEGDFEVGHERPAREAFAAVAVIDAPQLAEQLDDDPDTLVLDLQPSNAHQRAHVPGARFAIRARLAQKAAALPGTGSIVITSEDDRISALAARELEALTARPVSVLEGGTEAWQRAGLPLEKGGEAALDGFEDVALSAWQLEDREQQLQGFRDYLSWEVRLVEELRADSTANFPVFSP